MAAGQERAGRLRPFGRAPSLRVPAASGGGRATGPAAPADRPSLRLAVSKGGLGIELESPFSWGPLQVEELVLSLSAIRFPVDLSGGVSRFRHRRGELSRLAVRLKAIDCAAWGAPRLRGLLGDVTPDLIIVPTDSSILVGLRAAGAAMAFDVVVAPHDRDLRLLPERARGIALGAPPQVLALRILHALTRPFGKVTGAAVVIPDAVGQLLRHVLPAAGARAPATAGVRWECPCAEPGWLALLARSDAPPPALSERMLQGLEAAELSGQADEAAFCGDLDGARRRYLELLERAPRHPELSRRLAWIDAIAGDRAEGALSTLIDAMQAVDAGLLGGELLAAVGDQDGALAAFSRAAQAEPFGPLSALAWLRVARLATDLDVRLHALDQAVVRAPALEAARWARIEAKLDVADTRGAKADAEHLEAMARGVESRHEVWRRVAAAFLARGYLAEAGELFERALRYIPDSAEAVAGLARSLKALGHGRRSLDLLARSAELAARKGQTAYGIQIDLARGLAEIADDRPAAIARVRAIPPGVRESVEARLLEGRWRSEIGDLAGASIALGRVRDAIELSGPSVDADHAAAMAAMLVEAARIEETARGDMLAAQRHLGLALRLRPRDPAIRGAFRRISALVEKAAPAAESPPAMADATPGAASSQADEEQATRFHDDEQASRSAAHTHGIAHTQRAADMQGTESDEALVVRLTDQLRADPSNHRCAMALSDVLARLGRDLELLALLSARMDEGDEGERLEVEPRRRAVLARLSRQARAEGRESEAELYEAMGA